MGGQQLHPSPGAIPTLTTCWVDRWEPAKRHRFGPALGEVPDVTLELTYRKCPKVALLFIFQNKIIILCAPLLAVRGPSFCHQYFLREAVPSGPLLDQFVEPRVGLQRDGRLHVKMLAFVRVSWGTPGVRDSDGRQRSPQSKDVSQEKDLAALTSGSLPPQGCWGRSFPRCTSEHAAPGGCLFRVLLQNS